jgi:integrase/recombinase XerD
LEEKRQLEDSVEWFLDHLKVERGASEHTILAYHRDLADVIQLISISNWQEFSNSELQLFDQHLSLKTSARTAQRKASSLRSFLKFLQKNGVELLIDLPSTGNFKLPKRLPKALSQATTDKFLQVKEADALLRRRDVTILELLYGCGLRVSELTTLRVEQIDFTTSQLRVTGKRQKTRLIPMPIQTAAKVREYLDEVRPQLLKKPIAEVFCNRTGGKLSRQAVYSLVEAIAASNGVHGKVGPHTFRHSYAVHLLEGGADLRAVQELLGHESLGTTQIYTELQIDEVRSRYDQFHPRR